MFVGSIARGKLSAVAMCIKLRIILVAKNFMINGFESKEKIGIIGGCKLRYLKGRIEFE